MRAPMMQVTVLQSNPEAKGKGFLELHLSHTWDFIPVQHSNVKLSRELAALKLKDVIEISFNQL